MPDERDPLSRTVLLIPDRSRRSITYDAKDPDTKFPIEQLRPPKARRMSCDSDRRRGLRIVERVRWPLPDSKAERLAAGGLSFPLSHHGSLFADSPGAFDRT